MTTAYSELYITHAQKVLGCMFDYAVHGLKMSLAPFHGLFITTGYAERFGYGEADIVAGHSGIELAHMVLEDAGIPEKFQELKLRRGRSAEYWVGTVLAYYQWFSDRSFAEIERRVPIKEIRQMYHPYHEMDIRQFTDEMDSRFSCAANGKETQLARLRAYASLSQSMLAQKADVPLRTIQQYEQRQKDIQRAGAHQLERMAKVLRCEVEDLTEF